MGFREREGGEEVGGLNLRGGELRVGRLVTVERGVG